MILFLNLEILCQTLQLHQKEINLVILTSTPSIANPQSLSLQAMFFNPKTKITISSKSIQIIILNWTLKATRQLIFRPIVSRLIVSVISWLTFQKSNKIYWTKVISQPIIITKTTFTTIWWMLNLKWNLKIIMRQN